MTYIDKGTHCGTRIVFTVAIKNDRSYHGDIRVLDNPKHPIHTASPMSDTLCVGSTEADVIGKLEAQLAQLVKDAQ